MMNNWEKLLASGPLDVPENFTLKVMQYIEDMPLSLHSSRQWVWLQWGALFAGAAVGGTQLLRFIFGIWIAAVIG